jgi:uncharacterized Rmd1/YagE family protein
MSRTALSKLSCRIICEPFRASFKRSNMMIYSITESNVYMNKRLQSSAANIGQTSSPLKQTNLPHTASPLSSSAQAQNSIPSSSLNASSSINLSGLITPPEPSKGIPVSVKAYYVARAIDLQRMHGMKIYSSARRQYEQKSVTITLNEATKQYISIFKYGSVVFFNIPEDQHVQHLKELKEAILPMPIGDALQHTENYKVIVHDNLDKPSVIKAEHLNIKQLDINNITIVSTVMAQSVALDYYAGTVDRMLESFMNMNVKIQEEGNFNDLSVPALHKLVASNNMIITTVLSKMGLFEGTDAAWENADYYNTWEGKD